MGRHRRVECRDCGRHLDVCGPLSARGLCDDCGERRLRENITTMIRGDGPTITAWQVGMLRAAGVDIHRNDVE